MAGQEMVGVSVTPLKQASENYPEPINPEGPLHNFPEAVDFSQQDQKHQYLASDPYNAHGGYNGNYDYGVHSRGGSSAGGALGHERKHSDLEPDTRSSGKKFMQRWRWPLILVVGLLIALISGVIGGFVGKTIEGNKYKDEIALMNTRANSSESNNATKCEASPVVTPSSTPTAIPTENTCKNGTTEPILELKIPDMKCPGSNNEKFRSTWASTSYFMLCNAAWGGNDLFYTFAPTPSDCIDSCSSYNGNLKEGDGMKRCVGGSFIPAWVNQSEAIAAVGTRGGNCYLKWGTDQLERNKAKFEVVSLCLEGQCEDVNL
ncbi:hypothetical protein BU24DRAFT_423407 [Aaosphaeria arxii CBS 175.79]|uniref:Uncharacterized protein n=1 Tax=Aaosphaeria arxii CBS 175.79 TaxID=1450172 RepID=A0A6A5XQ64_9PLEO|nr:uncharacterized protein BU24DRAFT_423407 [Aaosphaeria arxii CBS 175.79]KAF2014474.1 hypothetical protein BU24DRAFT_423407 [Aaosphaeria arxii CBS 175.79]